MGRELASAAEPLPDAAAVAVAIAATTEARQALIEVGAPPLDGIPDVRPSLDRARVDGSVLEGLELTRLVPVLDAVAKLQAYGRSVRPMAPVVAATTDHLPHVTELADRLRRALDEAGALTDAASPRLGQLRRDIRTRRRRVSADLERLLQMADAERIFADRYVTVRHERYVLPVRAEARARVPGIVHDRSQSGQTLFVEPGDFVEANNDLVQLAREEEQEVARILAELTAAVRARMEDLVGLVDMLGRLDWLFARAAAAERMDATAPILDGEGRVALRAARHPVLLAQSWKDPARAVVPVDLELSPDRPLLLVTGPNAGGKTVALKTLALCSLMTQIGCHVPAAAESRLPVFTRHFAIVGDDQSVAENLSTFSAFVKQIREILDEADARSLVLVDELGAGTDPDEGAALAQALLEELDARGALVMATTHLEPLRAFASTHPRARNASVEFDTTTLAPTFRLRYDRPGPSYALAIAARLGLAPALIARAQAHRSEHAARLGDLLERLDTFTRTEAERARATEARLTEAETRLTAARETEATAERRARETIARARAEAATLVADVRRALNAEWDRLRRADRSAKSNRESRRHVQAVAALVHPGPPDIPPPTDDALAPGMVVAADHLGLRGRILAITAGSASVSAGNVTLKVPLHALRRVAEETSTVARPARHEIRTPERHAVAPELLLLGRTTDEARDLVEQYLDDAFVAGLASVRVVHGKGTGALRRAVRALLESHPLVESFRDGEPSEGGAGATVAALKVG
jgi:DNA mismatch repair protein MutS2